MAELAIPHFGYKNHLAIFPRKTALCALAFLDRIIEEMPFPIQRIQTDRGQEFFVYSVQDTFPNRRIKFRPTKPRSLPLNDKVERVQRTAVEEFWPSVDLNNPGLVDRLAEWQHFYNWGRPHDSLGGRLPIDRLRECRNLIPRSAMVAASYDPGREHIRIKDYAWDQVFHPVKP